MNNKLTLHQDNVVCIRTSDIGGVKFVLAGNFRQTFPAISRENKLIELQVYLRSSYEWSNVQVIFLQTSAWVQIVGNISVGEFTENPLKLGNGGINKNLKRYTPLENSACTLNNLGFTTCGICEHY